jgi:mannose-6-phosphate isomerase-like protein (cupin superfamily)
LAAWAAFCQQFCHKFSSFRRLSHHLLSKITLAGFAGAIPSAYKLAFMKRRSFPKFPSTAAASAATDRIAEGDEPSREGAGKGFLVPAQKNRHSQELLIMGAQLDLKISGRDTNGTLCLYDASRLSKGGPALHRHQDQDEWFYVIRSEFIVRVGDDTFNLRPGDSAFAQRKVPHAYAMISEGEGQMLLLYQPAESMEDFFLQLSKMGKETPENHQTALKRLFEEHGMEVIGPPLKF